MWEKRTHCFWRLIVMSVFTKVFRTVPKNLAKVKSNLEIRGRIEMISTTVLLGTTWIPWLMLKSEVSCCHSTSYDAFKSIKIKYNSSLNLNISHALTITSKMEYRSLIWPYSELGLTNLQSSHSNIFFVIKGFANVCGKMEIKDCVLTTEIMKL